jgi:UDP-2,3-diacylglucosamine pyrophosphatase LpxH
VHYPTDINILFDAMRKVMTLTAKQCETNQIPGWRQHRYHIRQIKKSQRIAQLTKRGGGKTDEAKARKQSKIIEAHQQFIDLSQVYLTRANQSLKTLNNIGLVNMTDNLQLLEIEQYIQDAERQIDQIKRRIIHGDTIPHSEKVFSIFQRHTEWIVKGKAGINQELGLRVCIMEDQYQFILHHQVAVSMVSETQSRFKAFSTCSFDKGYHSPDNQEKLKEMLDTVALPRKGKRSKKVQALESTDEYRQAHDKHSAVESAINALEVHGLDRCPDHGIEGFKRYVALSVVARNLQRIGAILTDKARKDFARQERKRLKQAA